MVTIENRKQTKMVIIGNKKTQEDMISLKIVTQYKIQLCENQNA